MKPIALVVFALAAGCASDKPWVRAAPGASDDFNAAKAECSTKAMAAYPPDGSLTVLFSMKQAERACLMEKGWREPS